VVLEGVVVWLPGGSRKGGGDWEPGARMMTVGGVTWRVCGTV